MLEYLRDPLWQFIGAVLAAMAIFATLWIYLLQRARKGITYEVISWTSLLTVREQLEGKLQVTYEGEPAKSLTLIVLKVWNSGNQPILPIDFERPLSFCTGKTARLLSAAITQVEPPELVVDISTCDSRLILTPTLMNSGDAVTFKLLVRDAGPLISPDARIVGVKSVLQANNASKLISTQTIIAMVLLAVGFLLIFTNENFNQNRIRIMMQPLSYFPWMGFSMATLGYFIMIHKLVQISRLQERLQRLFFNGKNK